MVYCSGVNDDFLHRAAEAALQGRQVLEATSQEISRYLAQLVQELDRNEYTFVEMRSPKGSRVLEATHPKNDCRVLICQFKAGLAGLRHAGSSVRMTPKGRRIVNLPPDLAYYVYHKAVAGRN